MIDSATIDDPRSFGDEQARRACALCQDERTYDERDADSLDETAPTDTESGYAYPNRGTEVH
jgi:hypothetical protein